MTRARDLADSADKDITGTLTVDGMTVDQGNLLVGKTALSGSTDGLQVKPTGELGVTRDANHSLILNRKSSDGDIALFQKDGTTVGKIGTQNWGIGTASPTSSSGGKLLAIETTADEHTNLVFNTANTGRNGIIEGRRTGRSGSERFAQINIQNNSDNGELRFYTAPSGSDVSERMRIDASGRVTTPNQPSFTAHKNGNQAVTAYVNNTVTGFTCPSHGNVGSHFNTSNGRFTAPVTGFYLFTGAVQASTLSSLHIAFHMNGTAYESDSWIDHGTNTAGAELTRIMYLTANQYVTLVTLPTQNLNVTATRTRFQGYLLG